MRESMTALNALASIRATFAHPEDAAFVGNVWFWVLVVAAVVNIAWGLVEVL